MGMKHIQDVNTQNSIDRKFRDIQDPQQYLRELYQNCLEAGATQIMIEPEPEAWENFKVQRMMVLDNGTGMDEATLLKVCDLNASTKTTGGEHDNFGVGAKISCLPFNKFGMVIVTWTKENPEGVMIRLKADDHGYGSEDGEVTGYGVDSEDNIFEDQIQGFNTFKPQYLADLGVDWSKTLEKAKDLLTAQGAHSESGTLVVLCGNHFFDNTMLKDSMGSYASRDSRCNYLNQRYFKLPQNVQTKVGSIPIKGIDKKPNLFDDFKELEENISSAVDSNFPIELYSYFYGQGTEPLKEASTTVGLWLEDYESKYMPKEIQEGGSLHRRGNTKGFFETIKGTPSYCSASGKVETGDGTNIYWFIVDSKEPTKRSIPLFKEDMVGGIQVVYKDELYLKKSSKDGKGYYHTVSSWGIPHISESQDNRLIDRIKIFVEFPLYKKGVRGGVIPDETRTNIHWMDKSGVSKTLPYPSDYFAENLPQDISDLIESYQKAQESSCTDLEEIRKKISSVLESLNKVSKSSKDVQDVGGGDKGGNGGVGNNNGGGSTRNGSRRNPSSSRQTGLALPKRNKPAESAVVTPVIYWKKHRKGADDAEFLDFEDSEGNLFATSQFTMNSSGAFIHLNEDFPVFQKLLESYRNKIRKEGHDLLLETAKNIFNEKIGSALYGIMALRSSKIISKDKLVGPESLTQHFISIYADIPKIEKEMGQGKLKAYVIKSKS